MIEIPGASSQPLQFDTAVSKQPTVGLCQLCKQPIGDSYYTAGRAVVCAACKAHSAGGSAPRPTGPEIGRAIVFGLGGALAAAVLYYVVLAATGYNIGLIAIAAGFVVGRAVHMGARGKRGLSFQVMAIALTYIAIAAGMAPGVFKAVRAPQTTVAAQDWSATAQQRAADSNAAGSNVTAGIDTAIAAGERARTAKKPAPRSVNRTVDVGALIEIVLAIPVLLAFGNVPGSLLTGFIIFIGLAQAWVINRPATPPVLHGPFRVAPVRTGPSQ